jgi:hypothetical protein
VLILLVLTVIATDNRKYGRENRERLTAIESAVREGK